MFEEKEADKPLLNALEYAYLIGRYLHNIVHLTASIVDRMRRCKF